MKKTKNCWSYYRGIRTNAERRANGTRKDRELYKWCRPCRSAGYLDPWDLERRVSLPRKSWKSKREKQYHCDGRGKQHVIELSNLKLPDYRRYRIWYLEEFFERFNIPYHIEKLTKLEERTQYYERVWNYSIQGYEKKVVKHKLPRDPNGPNKQKTRWKEREEWVSISNPGWEWVKLNEPRTYIHHEFLGWKITWWYDKDIGIERELRKIKLW